MKRTLTIAVAALAAMAVGAPSALAGASHLAGYYKVEKHIDLEGESAEYTLSCPNSDIAVDGMWRIDNVDQDDDYIYDTAPSTPHFGKLDVLNSVEPVAAYADNASVSKWHFAFVPLSGGDVQGKLFLFCLPHAPSPNQSHTVEWLPSAQHDDGGTVFAAPVSPDTYVNAEPAATATCPTGQIAIQPGFQWAGSDAYGKPYKRAPTSYTMPNGWRSWQWGFFSPTGGTLTLTWRCLPLLSDFNQPLAPHHRHKLVLKTKQGTTPNPETIGATDDDTVQVICGEHYKAGLASWDFGYSGYVWNALDYWKKLWYLGMDPRPKHRAFRVMNVDTAPYVTSSTTFGALCFKDKTT